MESIPTVCLSELSPKDQERYFQLLVEHDIQFVEDASGAFLATIRIVKPPKEAVAMRSYHEAQSRLMKQTFSSQQKTTVVVEEPKPRSTTPVRRRRDKSPQTSRATELSDILEEQTKLNTKRNGGPALNTARFTPPKPVDEALTRLLENSRLTKFIDLLELRSAKDLRPKLLPIPALLHLMEEVYAAKYQQDTTTLDVQTQFPDFVARFFQAKYGKATARWAVDFVNSLEAFLRSYTEVQIFTNFLVEHFDQDDLVFFLFLRSTLEKELKVHLTPAHAGDKSIKDTRNLFLSFKQCAKITKSVFGPNEETLQQAFLVNIERAMAAGKGQPVLSASKFMESLLNDYHASRPAEHDSSLSPFDPPELRLDSVSEHFEEPGHVGSEPDSSEFLKGLESVEPRNVNLSSQSNSSASAREALRDMCVRYSTQQLVPQYIDGVVAALEGSEDEKAEITGQIVDVLSGIMSDLLGTLFKGDKLLWLRVLDLEPSDSEALRHVESLQRQVLTMQKRGASSVTGEDIEALCSAVLATQELRVTVGRLLSRLTAQHLS